MTDVIRVSPDNPDPAAIARAAECLRRGGLVAFPTETVYGLGVNALDREAVRRLFAAKQRPANDPLIVHVTSIDSIAALASRVPDVVETLGRRFWPGPLTLIVPRSPQVPDEVTAGLATVAVRVPLHPVARALIDAAALPVAAPSANLFSRPSPTLASHVIDDLSGRIDLVVDGGPTTIGVESTVLDLTSAGIQRISHLLERSDLTNELARLSSAALSSKLGFSVVAPISVTVPSSTAGRRVSCCDLFSRCISSTNSTVPAPPEASRPRARSKISQT